MAVYKGGVRSVPGSYAAPRPSAEELATRFIRGWEDCDYIREPDWAAGIVEEAFRRKFGETAANG